jgi:hypothetical protein
VDPTFAANVVGFKTVGMPVGAYFPLHPDLDPREQAEHHFAISGAIGLVRGELAPWCDTELMRGCTPAQVLQATIAWSERASELWQRAVTVYTYEFFDHAALANGMTDGATLAGTKLAMAFYNVMPPKAPMPWTPNTLCFWQNSGGEPVPNVPVYHLPNGCPCDTDYFLGDEDALQRALDPAAG